MKERVIARRLILFAFCFCVLLPSFSHGSELTLAVANSVCGTMKKVGTIFTEKTDIKLNILCYPSGLLAQGIIEGEIEADYFLSANKKWMNQVVEADLVNPATIQSRWGNQLIVASLPLKRGELKLQTLADLVRPEVSLVLMGDPKIAPYGTYAKEALINGSLWQSVEPKTRYNRKISLSIRTLKKYGLSRKGIVALLYQTNVTGNLLPHFVVPQHLYTPIKYFSAPLANSKHKEEQALFLTFLASEEASDIFRAAGFIVNP